MPTSVCCVYINVNPHKHGWRCVMGWRRPRHEADEVDAAGEHLEGVADAEGHRPHQNQPHGPGAERGGGQEGKGCLMRGRRIETRCRRFVRAKWGSGIA